MEARTCRPDIAVGATVILDTRIDRSPALGRCPIDRSPTKYIDLLDNVLAARNTTGIAGRPADDVRNTSIAHARSWRAETGNAASNVEVARDGDDGGN